MGIGELLDEYFVGGKTQRDLSTLANEGGKLPQAKEYSEEIGNYSAKHIGFTRDIPNAVLVFGGAYAIIAKRDLWEFFAVTESLRVLSIAIHYKLMLPKMKRKLEQLSSKTIDGVVSEQRETTS